MTTRLLDIAAAARSQGQRDATARPSQRRHAEDAPVSGAVRVAREFEVRASAGGTPVVAGFASRTEEPYEMWDMFGPYVEVVELTAFDATLAAEDLLVEFTLNHGAGGGIPMAHTRNATLMLEAIKDGDETGLWYEATVDASRHDVADMVKAMTRGDLAEASFKFRIELGQWSPDWMEYHIKVVNLHRGDVSAVNFGANPLASSGLKQLAAGGIVTTGAELVVGRDGPEHFKPRTPVEIVDDDVARRVLILDADTRHRT